MHTYYINIMQLIANLKASNKLTKHTHTYIQRQAVRHCGTLTSLNFYFGPLAANLSADQIRSKTRSKTVWIYSVYL